MPIYRLIRTGVFAPELVTLMGDVFEDVLKTLDLVDREDPVTTLVANRIIELVQRGVHDPVTLKQLTLDTVRGTRGQG